MSATAQPAPILHALAGDPDAGLPVLNGVPWPQGQLAAGAQVVARLPSGRLCPTAVKPLVTWADGSVRWGLVAFTANEAGPHELVAGTPDADQKGAVSCTVGDQQVVLDNGRVSLTLSATGPGPIAALRADGHDWISDGAQFELSADDASSACEPRRELEVIFESPQRARVRCRGAHYTRDGQRRLHYRLDVELWAAWPTVRLDYQFMNLEPGRAAVELSCLRAAWQFNMGPQTARHFQQNNHGLFYVTRQVRNPQPVAIVADGERISPHVADPAMLLDDVDYPFYLRAPLVSTPDWLGVSDGERSAYLQMHEFGAMRPKQLSSSGSGLALDIWPAFAGALELPQGRTRRQVMTLCFGGAECDAEWVQRQFSAPLTGGRSYVDPAWLRATGEFDQDRVLAPGQHMRFEKYLHRLVHLATPQSMFDLGDTGDEGYSNTYIGVAANQRRPGAPDLPGRFMTSGQTLTDPEFYETVWTNNEYDVIWAIATEIMRRGRYELWPLLEQVARHNIEVDFLHYSDHQWLHRATPAHSLDHTTTGAYPSHFWTQGLLAYYCLSGDVDALEVAVGLGDKIIENFSDPELKRVHVGFNREFGWPILALGYLDTYSGETRFRPMLDELVQFLVDYDLEGQTKPVNLSGVNPFHAIHRQIVGSFFGYASMVEGVDYYARLTANEAVRQWLVNFALALRNALESAHAEGAHMSPTNMHPLAMAIGYELTGDRGFLETGMLSLHELIDTSLWHSPRPEVKVVAMLHRALIRFLHHAQEAGLAQALDYR